MSLTLTACERACEHQAWRGGHHFLEADCLPLLSWSIKLVCVFVHDMYLFIWVKTRIYLYKHVHTRLNNVHTCSYLFMYIHVYKLTEMYIHAYKFPYMYAHVWTMYMTCMYYTIVHIRLIHGSDMYVHVYARWVGFQMSATAATVTAQK